MNTSMIVTVTPNPSIDRTVTLNSPLTRGAVHRVGSVTSEPGGKGVNVARALTLAGLEAVAVLPASANDPLVTALQASAVPFRCVPISEAVRTNLAITETDGTTTKLNERGAALDAAALDALTRSVVAAAEHASWVVMSGSLPPGVPDDWYADVVALLAPFACRVAVDTSEAPLTALAASFGRGAPDLIKPNAEELASLTGASAEDLETAVAQGDPEPVVSAAHRLLDQGARAVLATLGGAGAVLVDETGSWMATPATDRPAQHRRCGRRVAGRVCARRRRRGRPAPAAAHGRRLRQRRRRATRLGAALTRPDRPRCRCSHLDFAHPVQSHRFLTHQDESVTMTPADHQHRPGPARRGRRRRQGGGDRTARQSARRRRAHHRFGRTDRGSDGARGPVGHRPSRRHRHSALPVAVRRHRLIGFARLKPAVDFGAPDGPADLAFLIAAPESGGAEHMKLLSSLARALVRKDFVESLRNASTADEVVGPGRRRGQPGPGSRSGSPSAEAPAADTGRSTRSRAAQDAGGDHRLPDRHRAYLHGRRLAGRRGQGGRCHAACGDAGIVGQHTTVALRRSPAPTPSSSPPTSA